MIEYIGLAEKVEDGYTIFFPDFPGLGSAGNTLSTARKNAREALVAHIEALIEENESTPHPSSLDNIVKLPEAKNCIPLIISIVIPTGKSQRINITLDTGLLRALDEVAVIQHKSRSALLAEAAQHLLREAY